MKAKNEEQCLFSSKVLQFIGKSYILTIRNNDNWTFLIFSVVTIVFPLELETRLYIFCLLLLLLILCTDGLQQDTKMSFVINGNS